MKRLLNTLYVLSENAYVALDGENVVVKIGDEERGRIPLHTLESIICFSYAGASPALMGACAQKSIGLSFFSPRGRFLAMSHGGENGNVLLRKKQYQWSENPECSLAIARNCIAAKVHNSRWILERGVRDHALRIDAERVKRASHMLADAIKCIKTCDSLDELRGFEGESASIYFGAFDELILRENEFFVFTGRVRRPPTDPVNAMLSLFYTVLSYDCAAALEGAGLDPYVGFLHADRPGRHSLALDIVEELRAVVVDRFVISAINNRVVNEKSFIRRESGECLLTDSARKSLFSLWQERKRSELMHPYLKEKMAWGLIPHVQAMLLARFIRGDLDGYPAFIWK